MKVLLRFVASLLLLLNGIGAIYGGYHLISHPDGSSLGMDTHYLGDTPFNSYLVPGIILFLANGVFSFVVLSLLIFRHAKSAWFVMAQGAVLSGWIVIQILLVQMVYFLHYIMGTTGILLMVAGYYLLVMDRHQHKQMVL